MCVGTNLKLSQNPTLRNLGIVGTLKPADQGLRLGDLGHSFLKVKEGFWVCGIDLWSILKKPKFRLPGEKFGKFWRPLCCYYFGAHRSVYGRWDLPNR